MIMPYDATVSRFKGLACAVGFCCSNCDNDVVNSMYSQALHLPLSQSCCCHRHDACIQINKTFAWRQYIVPAVSKAVCPSVQVSAQEIQAQQLQTILNKRANDRQAASLASNDILAQVS